MTHHIPPQFPHPKKLKSRLPTAEEFRKIGLWGLCFLDFWEGTRHWTFNIPQKPDESVDAEYASLLIPASVGTVGTGPSAPSKLGEA